MRSLFVLLIFLSAGALASVNNVQLNEKYKDWLVYTALEDGEKVCYIVSHPKKKVNIIQPTASRM